jgi:hypothetical protein
MNPFWVILVVILVLIYIISPIDGIPDIIPFFGWLDDSFLLGLLVYYLRYGRLPGFMPRAIQWLLKKGGGRSGRQPGDSFKEKYDNGPTEKGPDDDKDPYAILGVTPGASPEEIQVAYRMAAQKYHPDKVAHLGDEFQELAQKKFVEIQQAYNILTQKHS